MADPAELPNIPGLTEYLQVRRATQDMAQREQQQGLQREFINRRAALGDNPSLDQITGLASQYLSPHEAAQYGLQAQAKKEALAATLIHHNELIDVARERNRIVSEGQAARLTDKATQDAVRNSAKEIDQKLQQQRIDNEKMLKEMGLDIQQQKVDQQGNKNDEPLNNFIDKIDATKRMIQSNPEAVGGRGMVGRGMEFMGSLVNPGQETPASNLQTQILDLQTNYRGLPGHAASRLKVDAAKIDQLIKGLGTFTTADQAIGSLDTLRDTISKQLKNPSVSTPAQDEPQAAPEVPSSAGTPQFPPAPREPSQRVDGVPYTTPKGVLRWNKKSGKWIVP